MSLAPPNPSLVVRSILPGLTIFSVPFTRFGVIKFGGRSTAVQLNGGKVLVTPSSPLDEETKKGIDALGTVGYLVVLDFVHTLYLSDFSKAYPEAKIIGPAGIKEKRPELTFAGVFGEGGESITYGFEDEIKLQYFPGHANKEIAVLHIPSKTLIQADLLFNLPATEQFSKTPGGAAAAKSNFLVNWLVTGTLNPFGKSHQSIAGSTGKDKVSMARDAKIVAAWDFERIIPCHGDVIETRAKESWLEVFKQFGVKDE